MKPNVFFTSMFPTVSLQEEENLNRLLDVFEFSEKFKPTWWGNDERVKLDYNRTEIVEKILSKNSKFNEIYFHHNKSVKYNGRFKTRLNSQSFFDFEFDKTMSTSQCKMFFDFTDKIAEVIKPNFGVTNILWSGPVPWENEKECLQRFMNLSSQPTTGSFMEHGPMGVGTRTYFSGDVLGLFGKEFVKNIPATIAELEWGGIRVDLLEKPWDADFDVMLNSWSEVMKYLESAQILSVPSFDEDKRGVSFSPNFVWENRKNVLDLE